MGQAVCPRSGLDFGVGRPAIVDFEAAVNAAIDEAPRTLIVDVARVDFVRMSGVQALAEAHIAPTAWGWRRCSCRAGGRSVG
ncbi:hypothetical protein RHCRD62_10086 [Rhodococcus sp. RD6.2]|uniref:hypothetical protein n=1 Tax=Rhodococcus sp. RD6.2 TaxID=260936 RepID=UPI00063B6604|nr:hypothetical protein [Rhodococcus sp. RD6.2]CRK49231.1 hypothetical protein RHCRD62_10086 [Rhodococcus sp. RD6.2]